MIFKVLKKDLKKKKSINIIIVIFVFMATLFISCSVNQLLVSVNGLDDFFNAANVKDYMIFTIGQMGEELTDSDKRLVRFLDDEKDKGVVESYSVDIGFWCEKNNVFNSKGEKIKFDDSIVISSAKSGMCKFFTDENEELKQIDEGVVYLGKVIMDSAGIKEGDSVTIKSASGKGYEKTFTVKGYVKDAIFSGEMMGNGRVLISDSALNDIAKSEAFAYAGLFSISTEKQKTLVSDINKASFSYAFAADRSLIKTSYVMDVVIALLLLMVSLGLVLIAVLILRFTIVFTINDSFKEIGIMKAIGIKDKRIRKIYIVKYAILTFAGAAAGFVTSIFVSNILTRSFMKNIVIKSRRGSMILQLIASALVVLVIILLAYRSTKRIRKMKPLDAIRNGAGGERFRKKGLISLRGKKIRTNSFMALNDLTVEWKKFIIPVLTSVVGVWLMVMPTNTINTLCSEKTAKLFSLQKSDFVINDTETLANASYHKSKEYIIDAMDELEKTLEDNGIDVTKSFIEVMYRVKIRKGDSVFTSFTMQGINTKVGDYEYDEGMAPQYVNEIAVTKMVADKIGAGLGDTVYIRKGDIEEPYIITAFYQSMNNLGEGIRFHEDAEISQDDFSGTFGFQVNINGKYTTKEIKKILEDSTGRDFNVMTLKQFVRNNIGSVIDYLKDYKLMIIIVVSMINVLVITLMQRTFMTREKNTIATLKSLGYSNRKLIGWQTRRMGLAVLLGGLIGLLTSGFFTDITAGQVFKFMGAVSVEYEINVVEAYIVYPLILVTFSLAACAWASRRVKKVDVKMINVE